MIKLKDAKAGDIAYFACGGKASILKVEPSNKFGKKYLFVKFCSTHWGYNLNKSGVIVAAHSFEPLPIKDCPFNIVKIERPKKRKSS